MVEMLSTRYTEDVDVEVHCEEILCMDKIRIKIPKF